MKNRLLLCTAIVFFLANSLSAQQNIGDLLTQRQTIISNGGSTISIDQQLYQLGHVPTAIVKQENPLLINFEYFHLISPGNAQQLQQRFLASYSFINNIEILTTVNRVRVNFNQSPTEEMINRIVSHFSFNGYEIH